MDGSEEERAFVSPTHQLRLKQMKTLALGVSAIAVAALIAVQHQRLGQLRAENVTLQQASAEAGQLKVDLAKSTGAESDAEEEIARLREENRDLLKLRNQVYQLRQATAQFEQVHDENQRLQAVAQNLANRDTKEIIFQPILIEIQNLSYQGMNTPEAAAQTFFWAEHENNGDVLSRCILPERWQLIREGNDISRIRQAFDGIVSIEIAACRKLDANTVQLGIQIHANGNSYRENKEILTFRLRDGEWKLDINGLGL
jgi:myosin heavy subunit